MKRPRVLGRKFKVLDDDVQAFCGEVRGFCRVVTPTEKLDAVPQDPTDNSIIECAVEAGSETIVTGDQHLLSFGTFRVIEILRVGDFLSAARSIHR